MDYLLEAEKCEKMEIMKKQKSGIALPKNKE